MKYGKRIVALALSVVVALGSVCYRPPKAEAVAVSSLVAAVTSSYLSSIGFSLVCTGGVALMVSEISNLTQEFADSVGLSHNDVQQAIYSGVTWAKDGVLKIRSSAADMLGQFEDWLIEKLGLIGEDGSLVTAPVLLNPGVPEFDELMSITYGDNLLIYRNNAYTPSGDLFEYYGYDCYHAFHVYDFIYDPASNTLTVTHTDSFSGAPAKVRFYPVGYTFDGGWRHTSVDIMNRDSLSIDLDEVSLAYIAPCEIYDTEGNLCSPFDYGEVGVSLSPNYESAPAFDEQYAMVIDTGMTYEDEQSYIDAVLNGAVTGTLTPTYTIEEIGTGDVIIPDEGVDTQTGILSWVKNIAQTVKALPKSIADAFTGFFAVDEALLSDISSTFNGKFGFLSTLHDLGSDLLSIDADSQPPVVYIHLEDAEGSLDYGGTVKALDMSWYQRYKADGDRIMSGFLWLGFLWLLFKRAPAIINGGEMVTDYGTDIAEGTRRRKR